MLKNLRHGDSLYIQNMDARQTEYQITGMEVVRFDASGIWLDEPKNRLALITCYPFDAGFGGPLRYLVWAEPVLQMS
ncbi:LPXTG-site transpeptidase family protein [hydrothermal vent metagenome]|uniref:LPXTG-site transpeptidase family protein n=1 Tax=hydrothermal vent metagenome TaxID=652676 RepID=A0A3B0RWQ9_9ZZZZ